MGIKNMRSTYKSNKTILPARLTKIILGLLFSFTNDRKHSMPHPRLGQSFSPN
jgi:hypothetical protein